MPRYEPGGMPHSRPALKRAPSSARRPGRPGRLAYARSPPAMSHARASAAREAPDLFFDQRLGELGHDFPDHAFDHFARQREHRGDLVGR